MARPSKYEELKEKGLLIRVEGWARDGLSNEQIAENIGITPKTLYEWQNKFSEFSESLKKGKDLVDREVENALLKNALGYTYTEQQGFKLKKVYYDENGKRCEEERLETIEVEKHKPAETTAQIFWLKNRKKEVWRDKQEVEHSGGTNNTYTEMTAEERRARIDELIRKRGT